MQNQSYHQGRYSSFFIHFFSLPFLTVYDSGLVAWRPPPLRVQNCSCSKLCLMSQPLSLSKELTSHWSVLMSSARHNSCRKLPASNCSMERGTTEKTTEVQKLICDTVADLSHLISIIRSSHNPFSQ